MTQVTSLPLSKELWEKGLRIETEWAWYHSNKINEWRVFHKREDLCKSCEWVCNEFKGDSKISAPSTDELLAVMPEGYKLVKFKNKFICKPDGIIKQPCFADNNSSEVLGKMILWLLDNGYKYEEKEKWVVT